jgi:hypothetical protein
VGRKGDTLRGGEEVGDGDRGVGGGVEDGTVVDQVMHEEALVGQGRDAREEIPVGREGQVRNGASKGKMKLAGD